MSRRLALVIGNAHFPNADDLTDLNTPLNDAAEVANVLARLGNFEVAATLLDETVNVLKEATESFFAQAERGDVALLYYSGHGFKARDGELYFAAAGTDTDRPLSTALDTAFLKQAMRQSRCRHIVVVLDSCYAGAFNPASKGEDAPHFAEALDGETVAVLASSRGGQLSFEGEGDLSRFTQTLLEGIQTTRADVNLDGQITLQELFDYASTHLNGAQTPTLRLSKAGDEIIIARGVEQDLRTVHLASVEKDAYLRTWLTARLKLHGYEVSWLPDVAAGEEAAQVEHLSRTSAALVALFSGDAIMDEAFLGGLRLAGEVHKHRPLVVPVDAGGWYEEGFAFDAMKSADFTGDWAKGLEQLTNLLERLAVPRSDEPDPSDILSEWKQSLGVRDSLRRNKVETYRSNWFKIKLPEYLYVHAFNPHQAFDSDALDYPAVREQDFLITFAPENQLSDILHIWESYKVSVEDFVSGRDYSVEDGSTITRPNHKLIDLLNKTLPRYLRGERILT